MQQAIGSRKDFNECAEVRDPHDFSFICPTEAAGFHEAQPAFKAEHTSIVGVSIDDVETHRRWAHELGGLSYPLLTDEEGQLARTYGVLDEAEKAALRATFQPGGGGAGCSQENARDAGVGLEWRPAPRLTAAAATKPMVTATAVIRERDI